MTAELKIDSHDHDKNQSFSAADRTVNEFDAAAEVVKKSQHKDLLSVVQINVSSSHNNSNLHRIAVNEKADDWQKTLLIQKNRLSVLKQPVQLSHCSVDVVTQNVNDFQSTFDCHFILNQYKLN